MTTHLITFKCECCGLEVNAHIDRKGVLVFSINDKLYSPDDVLTYQGYYVCIDCTDISNVRFKVFK